MKLKQIYYGVIFVKQNGVSLLWNLDPLTNIQVFADAYGVWGCVLPPMSLENTSNSDETNGRVKTHHEGGEVVLSLVAEPKVSWVLRQHFWL